MAEKCGRDTMRRKILRSGLLATVSGSVALGCGMFGQRKNFPDDPLLLSKKPVLGRAQDARPVVLASAEPMAPPGPAVALASAPRTAQTTTAGLGSRPEATAPALPPPPSPPAAYASGSPPANSLPTLTPPE